MKKQILIAYNALNIGGSTTSLLSLLNRLDYSKYDVDLLLNENSGDMLKELPLQVNLLPAARRYSNRKEEYIHRILNPRYMFYYVVSKWIAYRDKVPIHGAQYREWKDIDFFRPITKEYDVAIAFLEGDRCKFVARHIKAKRKIAWIHLDYIGAQMDPRYDRDTMCKFDKIVHVSEKCKQSFDVLFPELTDRTCVIENILVTEYVQNRALKGKAFMPEKQYLNIVSVCRVSFYHKGLDRAVYALVQMKDIYDLGGFHWYIVGDGADMKALQNMIVKYDIDNIVILLGSQTNPYPYIKNMDLFFLPSRFEGKPMAVTEAFMMGLPVLVTNYASAYEQVRDNIDGMVVENSENGVYQGLKYILEHPQEILRWKENVLAHDYSNVEEIRKVEAVIDGKM